MRISLPTLGDIFAIPMFLLLVIYFIKKPSLTFEEKILFLFALIGLIADITFVITYYNVNIH